MATKADFSAEEWKAMQEGITGAGMFVALVDRDSSTVSRRRTRSPTIYETHTSTATAFSSATWRPGMIGRSG
jgi:hypothetical protein